MKNKSTYSHFAKPADVWKHLVLCEVMKNEQPKVYIETNSACADYNLIRTPEQEYGIYYFLNNAGTYDDLSRSVYFNLENFAILKDKYMGSPGLVMSIPGNTVENYYFFDIEPAALSNIADFAHRCQLTDKVKTINEDSITGVLEILSGLPQSTLMHIDPYNIDKPSVKGKDYLDVFVQASGKGMKCILWYGFNTLDEKEQLNNFIIKKLAEENTANVSCVELIMDMIRKNTVLCNPGVLGNGILTSNLSDTSFSSIENFSRSLTALYQNSYYNGHKGSMYRHILDLK